MDPDGDITNPVVSRAPQAKSSSGRRNDRRVVSREVALPNSSRRLHKLRNSNTSDDVATNTHSSSSNRTNKMSGSKKKHLSTSSSSSAAARRSITASSSDRHHYRSSRNSTTRTQSSVKDSGEENHPHSRSNNRHSSSRSSRQHHHRDDDTRDTKQSMTRSKHAESKHTISSFKHNIVEAGKKGGNKSRASSSSSKHSKNETYQVFYDEHGKKIKVPKATFTTTSYTDTIKASNTPTTVSDAAATTPSTTMNDEDCGYRSSDFDTDSNAPDLNQQSDDDNSSTNNSDVSGIDGASDFDEEEEENNSDYIDGASELDDDDDDDNYQEDDDNTNLDYYEGEEDYLVIGHTAADEEESIDRDTTNSDDEMEEYFDDDVFSKEGRSVPQRSNSPELNNARQQLPQQTMDQMVRNFYGDELAAYGDPPTHKLGESESIDNSYNNMDPNEDEGATLRLDSPPTPESDRCNYISDNFSQMSVRGRDPPEEGRGCDPPFVTGAATASGSKRLGPSLRKSNRQKQHETVKKPEIKGILKKKEGAAPPPLAYFGRTSQSTSEYDSDGSVHDEDSIEDDGSDPDFSEVKSTGENVDDDSTALSLFEDGSVSTAKSGLRSGRFAEANAAAAAAKSNLKPIDDGDSSSDDEGDHDYTVNSSSDLNTSSPSSSGGNGNEFNRNMSYFMRTSDLGLTQDTIFAEQFLDNPESKPEPHYHHPSPHPPPGVQFNCDENWISVDNGRGGHSPIAPQAVDALVATGYRTACDPMMWTPSTKTRKFMTENGLCFDDVPTPAPPEEEGGRGDSSCLVWSGKFPHKHYGHDLPVVRSQGVVNMSPEDLVDLLMDSTRVKSYNVSSTGRKDELILSDGTNLDTCPFSGQRKKKLSGVVIQGAKIVNGAAVGFAEESDNEQSDGEEETVTEMEFDDDGKKSVRTVTTQSMASKERRKSLFVGVTKLVRSTNKVPMRKSLQYVTLLHCRALTDDQGGNGYIIVSRACTSAQDAEKGSKDVQRAEILLNVHIIRRLREKKSKCDKRKNVSSRDRGRSGQMRNRCLMINVVHVKSPIIPNMLAKKVSLSAASSFITDIRALTEEE